jgi:hypothetical protein
LTAISPQDQKILEQAFAKNPRPSKVVRQEIVRRVSLGEKEVQIWFQNRRQNSRKKAISQASSSDGPSSPALESADPVPEKSGAISTCDAVKASSMGLPDSPQTGLSNSQSSNLSFSSQQSSTSGYLANRRITTAPAEEDVQPALSLPAMKARTHVRSGSYLRLSMTDDGKAKVVDRGAPTPSPSPEKQPAPFQGRRRPAEEPRPAISLGRGMRASAAGRSRDSRTWEFWCDVDARNSLIERADQEASGSAAEAIGLIRSSSSRCGALKLNTRRMNSPASAVLHAKGAEPSRMSKAKLKRASTSPVVATAKGKDGKRDFTDEDFEHLNSESDKENRSPRKGAGSRPRGTRPQSSAARRGARVLGENARGQAAGASPAPSRRAARPAAAAAPSTPPIHVDAEVSAFMASGCSAASMPEELDCVQSLLSLSQGNWD